MAEPVCGQETATGEVHGLAGVAAGSDGTYRGLGGGAGYRFSRRFMVTGEYHHVTFKKDETQFGIPVRITGREGDLLAGLHILFPTRDGKVEPFISAGGGLSHEAAEGTASTRWQSVRVKETDTTPALIAGGRLRVYVSRNSRIRPEAKYMLGTGGAVLVSVGVFYQFH